MKGISTILAMILIVIIVVALIGLTYTFAVQMVQTTTAGASSATQTVTQNLQKTVDVVAATCSNTTTTTMINFTVRASGIALNGEISALLDGMSISSSTYETNSTGVILTNPINTVNLTAGQVKGFSYAYSIVPATATYKSRTLTVTAPAGDVPETLTNCAT